MKNEVKVDVPVIDPFWERLYQSSQSQVIDEQSIKTVQLHNDLSQPAVVDSSKSEWCASPAAGVVRILLEREGGEKTTRATSLVAYQSNSQFSSHRHPKGEEFLVLAGTFSDENGDYPAGTYVRNPPGSSHQPFSKEGCLIYVKLQQFLDEDLTHLVTSIHLPSSSNTEEEGYSQILFSEKSYKPENETVAFYTTQKEIVFPADIVKKGIEVLILSGLVSVNGVAYEVGTWLRFPPGFDAVFIVDKNTMLLTKVDHLSLSRHEQ